MNPSPFNQCGGIEEALHLWSCDDPYLYRVNTVVLDGDKIADCIENPLGIRSIELSKEEGFHGYVMGEGVCVIDPKGFFLEFRGLPEGQYSLKTYHHAPSSNTNSMDPNRERLKTLSIHQLPVAEKVTVRVDSAEVTTDMTRGKQLPDSGPGVAIVEFHATGNAPAKVHLQDANGARGVWLNGFELQEARFRD